MPAPKTAGEFVQALERSQLIAPIHLGRIRAQIPAPNSPGFDAVSFARAAVRQGLITPYQANQLMSGQPEGFFVGKYRLLDVLGQGGMGKVYLAEQMTMKRAVALKLVRFGHHDDPSLRVRFTREARAAAKLRHQNITQAYDFDQAGEYHYIAMEFIEGINLQEWVEKTGPIPWALAASYMSQAARGLEHACQHGLVHRDIKPGNLMVETTGTLKILDLGLVVLPNEVDTLTKAQRNLILGTADYMSPEQAVDSHDVDIRADIYSLGCVFFFLLTGRPPFPGKSAAAKIIAHQTIEPPSIQELVPEMPKRLAEILHKMMAKNIDERFAHPAELAEALKPFAQMATRAAPPYDLSLVRFSRPQVDKFLLFGAELPPTQQQFLDVRMNRATMPEFHIPPDMSTPSPSGILTSSGMDATQADSPGPNSPRTGTPRKSLSKISFAAEKPPGTPLPKSKSKLTLAAPIKKSLSSLGSPSPKLAGEKREKPKAARKSIRYLRWLIFTIPNVLAVLYILLWLYLR
jgi:serine/threonine protein kinase